MPLSSIPGKLSSVPLPGCPLTYRLPKNTSPRHQQADPSYAQWVTPAIGVGGGGGEGGGGGGGAGSAAHAPPNEGPPPALPHEHMPVATQALDEGCALQ